MCVLLFDVDGTLTPSGKKIEAPLTIVLAELYLQGYRLGIVGGGTFEKISWQLGDALDCFSYVFVECGAIVWERIDGVLRLTQSKAMVDHCNRKLLNELIRCGLREITEMPILFGGQHVDFRNGLVYLSPPGMQAREEERSIFLEQDRLHHLRDHMLSSLKSIDIGNEFEISYGGSVGIAISPIGWNKSQVLDHFAKEETIHYYGDRTEPDGNDYPIYSHSRVKGHSVTDWTDTMQKLLEQVKAGSLRTAIEE